MVFCIYCLNQMIIHQVTSIHSIANFGGNKGYVQTIAVWASKWNFQSAADLKGQLIRISTFRHFMSPLTKVCCLAHRSLYSSRVHRVKRFNGSNNMKYIPFKYILVTRNFLKWKLIIWTVIVNYYLDWYSLLYRNINGMNHWQIQPGFHSNESFLLLCFLNTVPLTLSWCNQVP